MRRSALALLLGCLLLVAGASALDGYDYYQTIEFAGCDQEVYQQDIVIHRTTGTAYNEAAGGLEVWHIYVGDHCREDYGDIRFVNSTGAELAYYLWPGYDSSSARVTVRLGGADRGGVLTVHYGNATAETTSDGDATYLLYDTFDGSSLDTKKWSAFGGGTKSLSSGTLTLYGNNVEYIGIRSVQSFSGSVAIETNTRFEGDAGGQGSWWWGFFGSGQIPNDVVNQLATSLKRIVYTEWGRSDVYEVTADTADGSTRSYQSTGIPCRLASDWGECQPATDSRLSWISGTSAKYQYGATTQTLTTGVPSTACDVLFALGDTHSSYGGITLEVQYVHVRAYSATPPSVSTFSGEQSPAAPPATATPATPAAGSRPKTTAPIPTLDEAPYLALTGAFGGNNQLNESTEGVDWLGIKDAAERPYTDLIGPFFYVIVFAIPFLMQWLRQGSMAVPAAIGIILGGIMLAKTPAEYHLAAIAFIALSILAVVWGVIKDRN